MSIKIENLLLSQCNLSDHYDRFLVFTPYFGIIEEAFHTSESLCEGSGKNFAHFHKTLRKVNLSTIFDLSQSAMQTYFEFSLTYL